MKTGKRRILVILFAALITAAGFGLKAKADDSSIIYDTNNFHDGTVGQYYEASAYFYCYNTLLDGCVVTGTLPPGVYAYVDTARSWVTLKGTPTSAGSYSFGITAESSDHKYSNAVMYTVRIAASNIGYTVNTKYCQARHEDGHYGGVFMAGELVTITNAETDDLFAASFKTSPALTIPTGAPGERVFEVPKHSFYMPAENVTVEPMLKNRDLGTYNHNAASKDTGILCGDISIATMEFAIEHDLIWADLIKEDHNSTAVNHGDFWYYDVDLDKNGTADLRMTKTYSQRWNSGGFGQAMEVLDGRNVYGTFTLNIPMMTIYKHSGTGLYSKIVFNMGVQEHTHSPKLVAAKAATCTESGVKEHYECSCGSWFWDAAGTKLISNHADAIEKPLGHNWSEWTEVKPATETEEGLRERHCLNSASHKETETIPKLPPAPTEPETSEVPPETTEMTEVQTETSEVPVTVIPPETTGAPTTEAPATDPAQTVPTTAESVPAETQKEPAGKAGSGNTFLWILLAVMAVIAGVLGGILIGRSGGKSKNQEAPRTDTAEKAEEKSGTADKEE